MGYSKRITQHPLVSTYTLNSESTPSSTYSYTLKITVHAEFNEAEREKISVDGRHGQKISIEYFEPYRVDHSSTPRSVRFSFGVVQPENRKDRTTAISAYEMKCFPHGTALIINNELFTAKEMSFRKGTAIDERNLTHVFRYLGYKVEVHRDLKSQEMLEVMLEMGERNHQVYDSFVCCILSHGTEGHVYGTDGEKVSLHVLTRIMDAKHCPTLYGKPKVFFLQACRGKMKERAVNISTDSGESMPLQIPPTEPATISTSSANRRISTDSDNEIPASADFFFGHATPLGYVAWRDDDHGSWYISELCQSLCEMYRYASLSDIMTRVNERVACGDDYKYLDYKVSPESTTRLQKNVFF